MENPKKISRKELFTTYKAISKIPLRKWQYRASIKSILNREKNRGKISYNIQLLNNETANIPAEHLEKIYSKLVEKYNKDSSRTKKRIQPSTESEYSNSSSSSEEEEEIKIKTTRSGRAQVAPVSFRQEFYASFDQEPKKKATEKLRGIASYSEQSIDKHSQNCFRCQKSGYPNGVKNDAPKTAIGLNTARTRLLLCSSCTMSCHNNCLPTDPKHLFDENGLFVCSKCKSNRTPCIACEKSLKTEKGLAFRCSTCFRVLHSACVDPDMYGKSECEQCIQYSDVQPQTIIAQKTDKDGSVNLLIQWKTKSYRHVDWVPVSWIKAHYSNLFNFYRKKFGEEDTPLRKGRYFPVEWTIIERILNVEWQDKKENIPKRVFAVFKDTDYGDALWDEPPSEEEKDLYDAYQLALERYIRATKVKPPQKVKQLITDIRRLASEEKYESHELKVQPKYIDGGILMPHQLEALNWLLFQWEKKQSGVLADDMGLGKTIQVISFLYVLFRKYNIYPFIVVVPNSTATNWIREFQKWAPDMSVVPFFGLGASRRLALDNEIFDKNQNLRCHAVVATYESIQESTKLQNLFWPVMIVDESQRLKNDESILFKALNRFHKDHAILLTGTPLQNNLKELFNIMNFIRPKDFHGTQAADYEDMTREQVDDLHSRLRPYFLRRTKEEILKTLPPKHEIIVPLSMTALQKEVYKSCLSRDIENLLGASTFKRSKGLNSIFANLRKTLNHPFLIDGVETPTENPEETQRAMIEACEKLRFFHQMLPKLRAQGHRVLLFSTMTRALDVIDDYLTHEEIDFVRLDGSDSERERVRSIDAFNAPKSKIDVFLLSTRAGGVGINLATADTVIIWDSDYNPYADLQAIGRAHRIGQTKMVLIYRFMTRLSVEERCLQIGRKKMALEHVVVEKMSTVEEDPTEDIESILKFGAQALFDNDDSADISYDSAAIDRLLDREQYKEIAELEKKRDLEEAKNNKGSFGYAKVWKADGSMEDLVEIEADDDTRDDFWEKFLINKQEEAKRKKDEKKLHDMNLGRGARKRANVSYSEKSNVAFSEKEDKKSKKQKAEAKEKDDDYSLSDTEDIEEEIEDPEGDNSVPKPEPPRQQEVNSIKIPSVDKQQLEHLNAAIQAIFERHCRMIYDYLIICGRDNVPVKIYQDTIQTGIKQLSDSLRSEFKISLNIEKKNMTDLGALNQAVQIYTKTKKMFFDKTLHNAIVQFERWKLHNTPLLVALGAQIRSKNTIYQAPPTEIRETPVQKQKTPTKIRLIQSSVPGSSQHKQPIQKYPQASPNYPQHYQQVAPQNSQQQHTFQGANHTPQHYSQQPHQAMMQLPIQIPPTYSKYQPNNTSYYRHEHSLSTIRGAPIFPQPLPPQESQPEDNTLPPKSPSQ